MTDYAELRATLSKVMSGDLKPGALWEHRNSIDAVLREAEQLRTRVAELEQERVTREKADRDYVELQSRLDRLQNSRARK
jgi:hypothetical protein